MMGRGASFGHHARCSVEMQRAHLPKDTDFQGGSGAGAGWRMRDVPLEGGVGGYLLYRLLL